MSEIQKKVLRWDPSPSTDVVSYIVQFRPSLSNIPFEETWVTAKPVPEYIIPDEVPALAVDGDYEIRILAVDEFGHRSDPSPAVTIPLDFIAPAAPGVPSLGDYLPG